MTELRVLARVSIMRLRRAPRPWISVVGLASIAVASALADKAQGATSTANHVMRGSFAFFVLPLVAYALVGGSLGGMGLRRAIRGIVALGAARARSALATALVAVVSSAALCGILAAGICVLAHGATDPPLAVDGPASFGIGVFGGAAYAAYFLAGAAIGKGSMRGVFLAFDWVAGSSSSTLAWIFPRGHVTSLLGGPLCAGLSTRQSSVILFLLLIVYAFAAIRLARRA
ncbi:MAG: hypothetical protein FWD69_05015 [Polyangiaceae bacterium]|nr:hypothetical protein [Polyangiaceae bacterium]